MGDPLPPDDPRVVADMRGALLERLADLREAIAETLAIEHGRVGLCVTIRVDRCMYAELGSAVSVPEMVLNHQEALMDYRAQVIVYGDVRDLGGESSPEREEG